MDHHRVTRFVARYVRPAPGRPVKVRFRVLHGGLQSAVVAHVCAHYEDRSSRPRTIEFVYKRVPEYMAREAAAYRLLFAGNLGIAPRLLGMERNDSGDILLYLEWIRASHRWPWRDTQLTSLAIRRLAHAHSTLSPAWFKPPHILARWDYERELQASALSTLEMSERARRHLQINSLQRNLPALRRIVNGLSALRNQLRTSGLGTTVLHGDAHSGNVILRVRGGSSEPVLLDWGRTRIGSPLEDVSSWLQSLSYWEPQTRRRHDTLLQHYLAARGFSTALTRNLRSAYWLAAASNGLAGAIRYHLSLLVDENSTPAGRNDARAALDDWFRVVRRADAVA